VIKQPAFASSDLRHSAQAGEAIACQQSASPPRAPLLVTLAAVSGASNRQLTTHIEPRTEFENSTGQVTATAAITDSTSSTTVMSPALVMIDRCLRPAFNSPDHPQTGSPASVQHHQHAATTPPTDMSLLSRDGGGSACCVFPSLVVSSAAAAKPEIANSPTPTPVRPTVVTAFASVPDVPLASSSSHPSLPLHDALSRFRIYRRSVAATTAASSWSMPPSLIRGCVGDESFSCRLKMCSPPTLAGACSGACFRRDAPSSNAPDDEVRDLLETGSSFTVDDDYDRDGRWRKRCVIRPSVSATSTATDFSLGIRGWEHLRHQQAADDDMVSETTEIGCQDYEVADDDGESDDGWIDAAIDVPLSPASRRSRRPAAVAVDSVIAAVGTASLSNCVQRPSLDFDKMQVSDHLLVRFRVNS
jgi:hypothetical protein